MLNFEFPPLGGGAAPFSFDLAKRIVEKGNKVDVITMNYKGLKKYENIEGINIYRVSCMRRKKEYSTTLELFTYLPFALIKALKLSKKNKYDLNHTHFIVPTGIISYILKKLRNIPYIITSHGSDVPGYNPDRFGFEHKLISPIWKKIIDNSEKIVTPSKYLKNLILKKYKKDKIQVIYNGVNIEDKVQTKKENIILFAGRLLKRKGVQYIFEAIKNLDLGNYNLVICGDGPYRKYLEIQAKKIKKEVIFKGWINQKELKKIYTKSKIFILPSTQESFGMVIAEAMEKNMATISGKGSACSEVMGKTGITVDPTNSLEIKKAITFFIKNEDLIKKSGELGRNRVKKLFNIEDVTDNYILAYSKIIENKLI
jgi:glycosyltransferase involved in cell wall biosynthesis